MVKVVAGAKVRTAPMAFMGTSQAHNFELLGGVALGVVVTPGLTETPSHSRAVGNQLLPVNGAADVAEACANASRSIGAPASAVSSGGSSTAGLR